MEETSRSTRRSFVRVEVDFYMPMSYSDIHFVETEDRGKAAVVVLGKYTNGEMRYLNLIHTRLCGAPSRESREWETFVRYGS